MKVFDVIAEWDTEASVWVAHSDDFPGLVAEDSDWDSLKNKLSSLAAELVALNSIELDADGGQLRLTVANNAIIVPVAA